MTAKERRNPPPVDQRDLPLYTISQASYVVGVPESTLDRWFYGHTYATRGKLRASSRVIAPADADRGLLSFTNLTEAHVLESIRERRFPMATIRDAIQMLESYGAHPLTSWKFLHNGKKLFVRSLVESEGHQPAISVSRPTQGQIELGNLLDLYLDRITRDDKGPFRLFPMRRNPDRRIMCDLFIASGEPVISGTGILAQFVYERHTAGEETIAEIAQDYGIDAKSVEDAIRYVSAA